MAFQLNCKEPGPVQGEESQEKEGLVVLVDRVHGWFGGSDGGKAGTGVDVRLVGGGSELVGMVILGERMERLGCRASVAGVFHGSEEGWAK
jgi:hypothetical protein